MLTPTPPTAGMAGLYYLMQKTHEDMKHSILDFIQANPRLSKDALIEGIKEIIKNN